MRATSRLFRTVLVAAGLLAISASAAQAMPTGITSEPAAQAVSSTQVTSPAGTCTGTWGCGGGISSPASAAAVSVMQPAVDSPTDQTVPLVISQPAPAVTTVSAGSGFGWTDAGIGAAVTALLLIAAGFAATRMRPRQTAAL